MSDRVVLVIGGTRGTGLLIVRRLVGQGTAVRVLARDPARATALFGSAVDVAPGDLTKEQTLPAAVDGVTHIVLTAGRRSGHAARERDIIATEYEGVLHTLAAAHRTGFTGRFLYMTSSGVARTSLFSVMLNLYKGNTLKWRRRAEDAIRSSGLSYTIIRAGMLLGGAGGRRAIKVTQRALPLSPRYRIARADVAEAFVAALNHPCAERATFEIVWGHGRPREPWSELLASLKRDSTVAETAQST